MCNRHGSFLGTGRNRVIEAASGVHALRPRPLAPRGYSDGIGNALPGTQNRIAQQFWGLRSIDDAIARRVDADADGSYNNGGGSSEEQVPGEGTWFHVTDVQFSVVALIDDIAVLTERVRYDAYGRARHRWPTDLDGDADSGGGGLFR